MNENIYEVTRDEYVGFVNQINPKSRVTKQEENEGVKWLKTFSKGSHRLLCAREIFPDETEHYYVFEMPLDSERIAAKPVRKIVLENKEEVQAFFDILSQLNKEKKDAGDI